MESDLQHPYHFLLDHQQHHQKQMNSGLTRYQSAPSSFFTPFDLDFCGDVLARPSSPETQRILEKILDNPGDNISNQHLHPVKQESPVREAVAPQQANQQANQQAQMMASVETNDTRLNQQQQQSNYSFASQGFYQSQSKPPLPNQNLGSNMGYRMETPMGMERLPQMKTGGVSNSNLVRHSSSPAGFFSNLNIEIENGYPVMRGMGDSGTGNRQASYSAASRPPLSSGRMSSIAEIGNRNMGENKADDGGFSEARSNSYATGFPIGSWDDSSSMSAATKGLTDGDRTFSGLSESAALNEEEANRRPMLSHHLSLTKTSLEMDAIEKLLHFQDSVPCKIRAKRGCATHPRSIAERVRRTRISERMRKLQDLVPNMDKQTNTSDMLDLAVEYIKDLQRQVKTLSEHRAKCTCMNKQQQ